MERSEFKERLKQYKKAREENPGLKYWEWKDIPKYDEGGEVIPTQEEYITQHLKKSKSEFLLYGFDMLYNSLIIEGRKQ